VQTGARFMTMNDIADIELMRREDEEEGVVESSEEGDASSEDEEADDLVDDEEEMMIAEPGGMDLGAQGVTDDDDDSSEDEDESPKSGFQARLERLRRMARGKRPADATQVLSESSDDDFFHDRTWAEEDDDFIAGLEVHSLRFLLRRHCLTAYLQELLDENDQILAGHDRKERSRLFRAIHNGAFDDMEGISPSMQSIPVTDSLEV
jgi:hypothetical protein